MNLVTFSIQGYKRFEEESVIDLNQKLIALIGPNEAGKSSVLNALIRLDSNKEFSRFEKTRESNLDFEEPVLTAKYLLNEQDFEQVSKYYNDTKLRYLTIRRYDNGGEYFVLDTPPKKNPVPRETLHKNLKRILKSRKWKSQLSHELVSSIEELEDFLSSYSRTQLENKTSLFDTIKTQVASLEKKKFPQYVSELVKEIDFFVNNEKRREKNEVYKILKPRIPSIIKFDSEDRFLKSSYNINNADELNSKALINLCEAASLDLDELLEAKTAGDMAKVLTILRSANSTLETKFSQFWSQAKIFVRLHLDQTTLSVHIEDNENIFSDIGERSDGLRQYVALMAFACSRPSSRRIILIDEAEIHLHYDAQADLIQMLAKQTLAEKIIYTTHSAGCLPEDLGHGVRLVQPISETRSKVTNWFWSDNNPGFSSLLFGMGAETLAFVPMRNAVVAEGPTDMLLLPTLLRQANNLEVLNFQIAPGISNSSNERIKLLNSEGSKVVFLVDSDKGGDELKKNLIKNGIDRNKVISLTSGKSKRKVLEDLIDPSVYTSVINTIISGNKKVAIKDLGDSNRPNSLKLWGGKNKVKIPSKRMLAIQILNHLTDNPDLQIFDRKAETLLKNLYEKIIQKFV